MGASQTCLAQRGGDARLNVHEKSEKSGSHDAAQISGRQTSGAQIALVLGGQGACARANLLQKQIRLLHFSQFGRVGGGLESQR